jgi:tetratricopeptide (TPR) repeat protein
VCSTLAVVLAVAPSLSAFAAAPSKSSKAKKDKVEEVEAPKDAAPATTAEPDKGDPEALSAAAVERFEAKDYDAAVALFEQAYAADPQPNYLFNIGRVYEEKGDLENAVVYYQRFVGQSGVDLESRQAATDRLKVLREALAQIKGDEPKDDPEPPKDDVTTEPPPDEVTPPDEGDAAAAKRKKTLRYTGYGLMAGGGAALIVGAVFGGLASGTVDDADADPFIDRKAALRERATTQAHVADAMFITGGVLAAAGLVLVLATLGAKKAGKGQVSRKTMWSPVVSPQQVGLGLTHRF